MGISSLVETEHASLGQEIAGQLRQAIIEGRIAPGERLVEASIAERLGVSRGPVRDAILELQRQGLVVNAPRRSAFVVEVSKDDIEEIYTLRMVLEAFAARLAAQRITAEQCQQLQETVDALETDCDLQQSVALDIRFHDLIGQASGHSRLRATLSNMHLQTELLIGTQRRPEVWRGLARLGADHQGILDAIRSGDTALAQERMRNHIEDSGLYLVAQMSATRAPEQQGLAPQRTEAGDGVRQG